MKVSSDRGEGDLVLLVGRLVCIADVQGVAEHSVYREESRHEAVPI